MIRSGRRPKLLFLVSEDWYFVSHRLPLALAARDRGYDVVVATRVRQAGSTISDAGLRLINIEFERSRLSPWAEYNTLKRLVALYRSEAPDLVHHVAIKPVIYGSLAARLAGTGGVVNALMGLGFIYSSQSWKARLLRPPVSRFLKLSLTAANTRTIVQNSDDLALLVRSAMCPTRNLRLIPGSGVDPAKFSPTPFPADHMPLIVLPARLLKAKGVLEFIQAAEILKSEGVQARFALAGAPDPLNPDSLSQKELEAHLRGGAVEYLGWRDDMPALLTEASLVCLPSYYGEGVPKVLIEAAASSRPIITTDMPGCREIVLDRQNGWLVRPRDANALAEAMRGAIAQPELCREYGAQGRKMVEQRFSLDAVVQQTLAIYDELCPQAALPR